MRKILSALDELEVLKIDASLVKLQNIFDEIEHQISRLKFDIIRRRRSINITREWNCLSNDAINKLNTLNDICHDIQVELLEIYSASSSEIMHWIVKPSKANFLDYELPVLITCYIGKDDPEWNDDNENLLVSFDKTITIEDLRDNINISDVPVKFDKPISNIFYALCDKASQKLSLKDILRIKTIWAEVHTWKQCKFEMRV